MTESVSESAGPPARTPEPLFPDWDEGLYQQTCAILAEPEKAASARKAWFSLVGTLGLFGLSFLGSWGLTTLGTIVLVLLFHEAGHFLGMRLFGYRNVRMFFIPFFGAAVSGRKHAAPVWQQAVILLLGPLPGIILGTVLAVLLRPPTDTWMGELVLWLIILNGFNLLPLVPLDGGRLLAVLLFTRRPTLAAGFQVFAAAGLGALAWLSGACILWGLAGLVLLGVPLRYHRARRERAFADNPFQLPERIEDLDEGQRRELFGWAILLNRLDRRPKALATTAREVHENMVSRRPAFWSLAGLILLYLGGIGASVTTLVVLRGEKKGADYRAAKGLAESFEASADAIDHLRQEANRSKARGNDSDARRLEWEAGILWEDLVQAWRDRSKEVQGQAVKRLLSTAPRAGIRQGEKLNKLQDELNKADNSKDPTQK